jgi:inosine/xanthosine triphosphatase
MDCHIRQENMKVAIGSKNPVKIQAVKEAFEKVWPDQSFHFEGVDIKSTVSDQPMSDDETILGATYRADYALTKLQAEYGVGLEGGMTEVQGVWFTTAWIVVINKKGEKGIGSTIHIQMPDSVMKHIHNGMELGHVDDLIFGQTNSKQGDGHFGLRTDNIITRKDGYRDGVIIALSRFLHPEIFEN